MNRATVYVVDDDPRMLRAMDRLLRTSGYSVKTYSSAVEFLEVTEPACPGCVVLDLRMPEINGLDVQRLLANGDGALPIIFVTGQGDVASSVSAMKAGAVDFLTKPFDDHELLAAIEAAVVRSQQKRAERESLRKDKEAFARLTPRERQVCVRIANGMLNKQVGFELGTSEKTIKAHRARVMQKLRAESLADVVRLVERLRSAGVLPHAQVSSDRAGNAQAS
jgi:FixJ family two-component response regulator